MDNRIHPHHFDDEDPQEGGSRAARPSPSNQFKKLTRPLHATKRSNTPERLHGMHRRRRRRMGW